MQDLNNPATVIYVKAGTFSRYMRQKGTGRQMKLIEALKKIKDLARKGEDIKAKIALYCADLDADTPAYKTADEQKDQIAMWLQAHHDLIKEIEKLRVQIQKTNLATVVTIEILDGQPVSKCITAWIHRRRDLAAEEARAWAGLTNRNLKPRPYAKEEDRPEGTVRVANIRKYYNQKERDAKVEEFTSEPSRIDAALEVANATTDLLD